MQAALMRFGVVAVALGAVAWAGGSVGAASQERHTGGPDFVVNCTMKDGLSDGAGLGTVTCTLKVTGLPAPLEDEVVFVWSTGTDSPDDPLDSSPAPATVSATPPGTAFRDPVLVSHGLFQHSTSLPPATIDVPKQPPQSL